MKATTNVFKKCYEAKCAFRKELHHMSKGYGELKTIPKGLAKMRLSSSCQGGQLVLPSQPLHI